MAKRGRPRFEPTEEQRRNVEIMTGLGIPQTDICLMVRGPKGHAASPRDRELIFGALSRRKARLKDGQPLKRR